MATIDAIQYSAPTDMGIHCVAGRRSWDRTDVPYLPEHEVIAMAKNL